MRHAVYVVFLVFFLAGCASQGQRGAEIEQRDLQEQEQQRQAQADAARQAEIAKEQEELKRQLEEQQQRQQQAADGSPDVRSIADGNVGASQLDADPWAKLKEPGSMLGQRTIYYDFDRYEIKDEFVPIVEAHAKFLADHPDIKVAVQGNCDDRGSREYNVALGQRRADSVKRAMALLGVSEKQVETVSFGAEKPVALGQDEESWAKNRRSDIVYMNEPQQQQQQ
jgi:peptidoglycan-associated lipoprotein